MALDTELGQVRGGADGTAEDGHQAIGAGQEVLGVDVEALEQPGRLLEWVTTCKIGLEQGIAREDYPIIRLVPTEMREGGNFTRRKATVLIYFGAAVDESTDGLEGIYQTLLGLEEKIIDAAPGWRSKYLDTITDEDRLELYKLMAVRVEVKG